MESRTSTKRKILSFSVYLIIAVVFAYLVADRNPPSLAVGQMAPLDAKIVFLNGTSTTFRKQLKKPTFVNFWASWCPHCIEELPTLSKIAQKYQSSIAFLGPAVTTSPEDIVEIKKRFFINYEMFPVADDVVDTWQGRALPTTYLLNSEGIIVWAHAGTATEEQLERAIKLVKHK